MSAACSQTHQSGSEHRTLLLAHLRAGRYPAAIASAELYEIDECLAVERSEADRPSYDLLLLAYLHENRLDDARFLWKRIPSAQRAVGSPLASVGALLQALWSRNYADFYRSCETVAWSDAHLALIQQLVETTRMRTLALISRAYTSISVQDLASYIGVSVDDALRVAGDHSWTVDSTANMVQPKPLTSAEKRTIDLEQVTQLTQYITQLEHP